VRYSAGVRPETAYKKLWEKWRKNAAHNLKENHFLGGIGMKNKMLMKTAAFLLVFAGLTAAAFGQITISGGLALSGVTPSGMTGIKGGVGIGGNVYVDYLLPVSIPLSLGGEIGVDTGKLTSSDGEVDETIIAIPLLARVAYHFDLMPKLDLYVVGKLGIVFGNWTGKERDALKAANIEPEFPPAISFGFDVGAAYYFSPVIGVFAEAGFDRYDLKAETSGQGYNYTIEMPFNRFVTIGISTKF
jgi:hypothetical protein